MRKMFLNILFYGAVAVSLFYYIAYNTMGYLWALLIIAVVYLLVGILAPYVVGWFLPCKYLKKTSSYWQIPIYGVMTKHNLIFSSGMWPFHCRIFLSEYLWNSLSKKSAAFVLFHEINHIYKRHTAEAILMMIAVSANSMVFPGLLVGFIHNPGIASFILVFMVSAALYILSTIAYVLRKREMEHSSDRFAVDMVGAQPEDVADLFKKLGNDNGKHSVYPQHIDRMVLMFNISPDRAAELLS